MGDGEFQDMAPNRCDRDTKREFLQGDLGWEWEIEAWTCAGCSRDVPPQADISEARRSCLCPSVLRPVALALCDLWDSAFSI